MKFKEDTLVKIPNLKPCTLDVLEMCYRYRGIPLTTSELYRNIDDMSAETIGRELRRLESMGYVASSIRNPKTHEKERWITKAGIKVLKLNKGGK